MQTESGALSGRSVLHIHRVLFAAFQRAVTLRLISSNPCMSEAPTAKKFKPRTLTAEEGRKLIAAAEGTRLHLPIMLALSCGLRRGEVCAIKWSGIDFERGTLHISESLQGDATFAPPKTERSRRTIALPASALAALRLHKAKQNAERLKEGELYRDLGLVFAYTLGEPWKPSSIATLFGAIAKRAGHRPSSVPRPSPLGRVAADRAWSAGDDRFRDARTREGGHHSLDLRSLGEGCRRRGLPGPWTAS